MICLALHLRGFHIVKRIDPRIRTVVDGFGLTPREAQLVELIAVGYSTEDIAEALDISTATVRTHIRAIFNEVGVSTRAELVARIMAKILRMIPHKKPNRGRGR